MTDEDPGATINKLFGDIPQLLRSVVDRFLEVGHARMDLLTAEIRAEVEQRIRRLILVIVPVCFLLTALGLANLGLVAWLSESMGPVAASFLMAGIYAVIGILWLLLWQASGGMNPKPAGPQASGAKAVEMKDAAPRGGPHDTSGATRP